MDPMTGLLLWSTEACTLAFLLIAAWMHDRDSKVTGLWGLGFACHGIGVCLVAMRGSVPDLISIVVANEFVLCGIALWSVGVCAYDGVKLRPWIFLPALVYPVVVTLPFVMPHFWMRTVVIQWASASGYLLLAYSLLIGQHPKSRLRRAFALVALVQAAFMMKMGIETFFSRPNTFTEMPHLLLFSAGNIFCLVAGIMLGAKMLMVKSEERLQKIALTDPLTGVFNRRGLLQRFEEIRNGTNVARPFLALIIFDLDSFKQTNDAYGHSTGDRVLQAFCATAQTCIGSRGDFGRLGGEEFACILPVTAIAEAVGLAEAIRLMLAGLEIQTDHGIKVSATVSAGIFLANGETRPDLDTMLNRADKALYFAKNAGRNRTALDDGVTIAVVPSGDRDDGIASSQLAHQEVQTVRLIVAN